jgi:hypothetical protein
LVRPSQCWRRAASERAAIETILIADVHRVVTDSGVEHVRQANVAKMALANDDDVIKT